MNLPLPSIVSKIKDAVDRTRTRGGTVCYRGVRKESPRYGGPVAPNYKLRRNIRIGGVDAVAKPYDRSSAEHSADR